MSVPERYDAIVIGSGQAGGPLASALANAGRRTALIERTHVGGTCINEGCTPTKTMVASARVAYLARRGADYGVDTGEVRVDLARVRERKRRIVASFRDGSQRRLESTTRLDLIFGEARFTGDDIAQRGFRLDFAGGAKGKEFFMKNGGFFDENVKLGSRFTRESAAAKKPSVDFKKLDGAEL